MQWNANTWNANTYRQPHSSNPLSVCNGMLTQVSFAKEPYKRDDILQKRPIILWSLPMQTHTDNLIRAIPCLYAMESEHWNANTLPWNANTIEVVCMQWNTNT